MKLVAISCVITFLATPLLIAQDSRTVTEPTLPPVCTSLDAHLSIIGHSLGEADERLLDTGRIQQALDACGTGHGVLLRLHGRDNAFLSGPLELREGVTLIVDKDVTLFASRDPAIYEKTPGSCGLVNDLGNGCKPLITAQHVSGAGVIGRRNRRWKRWRKNPREERHLVGSRGTGPQRWQAAGPSHHRHRYSGQFHPLPNHFKEFS